MSGRGGFDAGTLGPAARVRDMGAASVMEDLRIEAMACVSCGLYRDRSRVVFGCGPVPCRVLFIGEAPGRHEDLRGEPFVGAAGEILDRMLVSLGLHRESVFITNIVKCRPLQNREPLQDEIAACTDRWFRPQVERLQPSFLVGLGSTASRLFRGGRPVRETRGTWGQWKGISTFILYHPAHFLWKEKEDPVGAEALRALTRQDLAMLRVAIEGSSDGEPP